MYPFQTSADYWAQAAERERRDDEIERRCRNGRLARAVVGLTVAGALVGALVALGRMVAEWIAHASAGTAPAKRTAVIAAAASWEWTLVGLACGLVVSLLLVLWASATHER